MKIKHQWQFTLASIQFKTSWFSLIPALLVTAFLLKLGFWQLDRGEEKQQWLAQQQNKHETLALAELPSQLLEPTVSPTTVETLAGQSVQLLGEFDNTHTILFDNRIHKGRAGYYVLTPFLNSANKQWLLVNRGWVAAPRNRQELPVIEPITGQHQLTGNIYFPSDKFFTLEDERFEHPQWPLRVQKTDTQQLSTLISQPLLPFEVRLTQTSAQKLPQALVISWSSHIMKPEKHHAYAIQWFSMAIILIIMFVYAHSSKAATKAGQKVES